MKIVEKILAIGVLLSLVLKFSLIPGGAMLTLWTILILACIYYPFGFLLFNQIRFRHIFSKDAYKNTSTAKIIFALVAGAGLSTVCIGALFKLLGFAGANAMLVAGLIATLAVMVVSVIVVRTKNYTAGKLILKRAGIAGAIGLTLLLTPELTIVKLQYRNYPAYIEAYANAMRDPANEELRKKKETEYYRIVLSAEAFRMYEKSADQ